MAYERPDIIAERIPGDSSPILQGGRIVIGVVCQSLGKLTKVTAERVVHDGGDHSDILVHMVDNILSVGLSQYSSDFNVGFGKDCVVTSGEIDWTGSPILEVPVMETPVVTTGGSGGAGTYEYRVTAVDLSGVETSAPSPQTVVLTGSGNAVELRWSHISPTLVTGYKVYRKSGGTSVLLASLAGSVFYYKDMFGSTTPQDPPVTNLTHRRPAASGVYYVTYEYRSYTYNTPERYYSLSQVQEAHGVGSEASNIARLVLGKGGKGNGASAVEICVPNGTSIEAYKAAVDAFERRNIQMLGALKCNDVLDRYVAQHCLAMSDPLMKRERQALIGLAAGSTVAQHKAKAQSMYQLAGRYAYVLAFDGGTVYMDSWENTPGYNSDTGTATGGATDMITDIAKAWTVGQWNGAKVTILSGANAGLIATVTYNDATHLYLSSPLPNAIVATVKYSVMLAEAYTTNKQVDGCWPAVSYGARIASLRDVATSGTEKTLVGFNNQGESHNWLDTEKDELAEAGCCVIENRLDSFFIRDSITVATDTVENQQQCVITAEEFALKPALRESLRNIKGEKLTDDLLLVITNITKKVLNGLIKETLIRTWFPDSLTVEEDTVDPTKVIIRFQYRPIYPVRRVEFYYQHRLK